MDQQRIYVDHAETTRTDPRVVDAMLPYLSERWGNPSSIYLEAREARKDFDAARRCGFRAFATVEEALEAAQSELGGNASITLLKRPPQCSPRVSAA